MAEALSNPSYPDNQITSQQQSEAYKNLDTTSNIKTQLQSETAKPLRRSTAVALLQHLGTWVGNDLELRLQEVTSSRSNLEN